MYHFIQSHVIVSQVTTLYIVPPIAVLLTKHPSVSNYDLSSLENVISGAAALGTELREELSRKIRVSDIRQGIRSGLLPMMVLHFRKKIKEVVFS